LNFVPFVKQTPGSTRAPMLIPASCLLIFAVITALVLRRSGSSAQTVNSTPVTEQACSAVPILSVPASRMRSTER